MKQPNTSRAPDRVATSRRKVLRVDLWHRYRRAGDVRAREELIRQNLRLVRMAARSLLRQKKRCLSFDELYGAGCIGLIEAVDRFDHEGGTSFHYFAAQRIRGSMLDALRRERSLSRTVARRRERIRRAHAHLAQQLQTTPHPVEVAQWAQMSLREYWATIFDLERGRVIPIEFAEELQDPELRSLVDRGLPDPLDETIRGERRRRLRCAIALLPERDQSLLQFYYSRGFLLREIAETWGITEGRVSQLLHRALQRLRKAIRESVPELESGSDALAA